MGGGFDGKTEETSFRRGRAGFSPMYGGPVVGLTEYGGGGTANEGEGDGVRGGSGGAGLPEPGESSVVFGLAGAICGCLDDHLTPCLIMPSIIFTVPALSLTACPLTVCTPARPLRVRSEVSSASARGGDSPLF